MSSADQVIFVSLNDLVPKDHMYRKFVNIFEYGSIEQELKSLEKEDRYKGYGILRLFKCILLQFMEDLSDRELMHYLQENNSGKWFCDFDLTEKTPDYTVFSRVRSRIGTKRLSQLFKTFRNQLKSKGYISEVFTFVDATHLVSKAALWKERDAVIKKKMDKLNNETLPKVAHDKQAKIGCKGGDKFWYGYKEHVSLDMQSGLINKIAVTPANITDSQGFKHVCPNGGPVYADKGYCTKPAKKAAAKKQVHLAPVKKNNMKNKNHKLDRFYTKMRCPYERVFSKQNKRVRYVGIAKNQFSVMMTALCFNIKRLTVIPPPILGH